MNDFSLFIGVGRFNWMDVHPTCSPTPKIKRMTTRAFYRVIERDWKRLPIRPL